MSAQLWVAVIGGLFSAIAFFVKKWFEIRTVNVAILAEVQRLSRVIETHMTWWKGRIAANNTAFPLIPFSTPVFNTQAANIGQIDKEIVANVTRFYGYLGFINALQTVRPQYTDASVFDQQYLHVLEHALTDYGHSFNGAYKRYGLA